MTTREKERGEKARAAASATMRRPHSRAVTRADLRSANREGFERDSARAALLTNERSERERERGREIKREEEREEVLR